MLPAPYSPTLQYSICIFEFPKFYLPQAPYFKCSMFSKPEIPRVLCSHGQMFSKPYYPRGPYFQSPIFSGACIPNCPFISMARALYFKFHLSLKSYILISSAICPERSMFPGSMFQREYVPKALYSHGSIFPGIWISHGLRGPYTLRIIFYQGPIVPQFYILRNITLYFYHWAF